MPGVGAWVSGVEDRSIAAQMEAARPGGRDNVDLPARGAAFADDGARFYVGPAEKGLRVAGDSKRSGAGRVR